MSECFIWQTAVSMRFSYPLSKVTKSRKSYSQFPRVCRELWEHRGICVCSCPLDKTRIDAGNGRFILLVWNSAGGCCLQILRNHLFAKSPDPCNRNLTLTWTRDCILADSLFLCVKRKVFLLWGCIFLFIIPFISVGLIYNVMSICDILTQLQAVLLSDPIQFEMCLSS